MRAHCDSIVLSAPKVGGTDKRELLIVGRKPSEDYDYGEPGKWGEDPELIDFVEGDDDDED